MSCLYYSWKSDINNLAAALAPLKLPRDNEIAHQTYEEIQGTTKVRESSEHHGWLMGGGHLHLPLCCSWVKVMRSTWPQSGRLMTLAGDPEQLWLAAVHLLADALSTQEPQDCVVVGCGDHVHKLWKKMLKFELYIFFQHLFIMLLKS